MTAHKEPTRVAVYVFLIDVPGIPQDRQNKVAQLFYDRIFNRPLSPTLNPVIYDFPHALPGFHSDTVTKIWFLVDLYVTSQLDAIDLLNITEEPFKSSC